MLLESSSDKLLWLSSCLGRLELTRLEQPEERPSDPVLEAAQGLGPALALGLPAGDGREHLPTPRKAAVSYAPRIGGNERTSGHSSRSVKILKEG